MNLKIKAIVLSLALLVTAVAFAGCGAVETPYSINNSENYTVSIKFDANGGSFTGENTPIIMDSYDISQLPQNSDGKVEIPLLAPDNATRSDVFKATKGGYFLVGWYAQRTESADASGNKTYTYSDPWDFATDRVEVDPSTQHAADEAVFTLYAVWAPNYQVEFYALGSENEEPLDTFTFEPGDGVQIKVPAWNDETGAVDMFKFPKRAGYTFSGAYYDAAGEQPVTTETLEHPGTLNAETGTVENHILKVYVDYQEGEWYRIATAEQFKEHFSLSGNYELVGDLDFADVIWPTSAMYGNFSGKIIGNGHTIKNVTVTQTNNAKANAGLFGQLTGDATLQDVTFENITFTIQAGTRVKGTSYGLLCGTLSAKAILENVAISGQLQIDSSSKFGTDDYIIGLVCGSGSTELDCSGITCIAVGDAPESVNITVTDAIVEVAFATE